MTDQKNILREMRFDAGQAEQSSDGRDFYPVVEHLRALEPHVVLIVGDRGAGKSKLKRAATAKPLREALIARTPSLRVPSGDAEWLEGWPLHAGGPDAAGWDSFARAHHGDPTAAQELWFAYLAKTLGSHLDTRGASAFQGLLDSPGGDPEACFGYCRQARTEVLLAIAYDELDTILFTNWDYLGIIIRGLVSLWASYARRWRRIRAKLFLRTDFYRHHSDVVGADIAKLAANRVELSWSTKNLYGALIKHIANRSDELRRYCEAKVALEPEDAILGWIPTLYKDDDARPLVERLAGRYMGADHKKGRTFNWILDHLRDGNGKASPRSLVLLIEHAARREEDAPRARGTQLIHPIALRNALDDVSERHVRQAMTEFPWLEGLRQRLAADRQVPWPRKTLEALLRTHWDKSWAGTAGQDVRAPAENPRELIDHLVELGIVRHRGQDRYDVPDIFLAGLNLTRRGGIKK